METDPMMRYVYILTLGLVLNACTSDSTVNSEPISDATPEVRKEAMAALDLSSYGSLVNIMVPDRSKQGVDATVEMDDLSGYITISAGKNFQIILREEPTTLEDIRQELENEMMWTNTITPHSEHSMIIERALPDGSMAQFHFATVLPGSGSNVVMRSDPMGDFSMKDVTAMVESALSLQIADNLAASAN